MTVGKRTCNQCMTQMDWIGNRVACSNPACPNYALVQIPLEQMPEPITYSVGDRFVKDEDGPK